MTFKERIDNEKDNLTKIVLYNDRGLFFNLVERSAYAFHTRVKPFKVHVKTLKGLDMPYVYIGVPVEKQDKYLQGLTVTKDDQGNITAQLNEPIDENAFQAWKQHMISESQTAKTNEPKSDFSATMVQEPLGGTNTDDYTVIRQYFHEVKALNIASMTPMEAMLYLNNLQQKLKDINL